MTTMTVHDVQQGSPEWHALRAQHFCASEAAAMMGVSPYMTRSELLRQKATGIIPEVDAATQRRFDDGHATEAAFRPVVERIIGEDLYPVVGTLEVEGLPLLASFDGLTMDWQTGYEHKRINNDLRALRDSPDGVEVPDQYVWQLEQQMLVSGARGIWFCASDGTEDDSLLIYYESDPELRAQLIAGWKQFAADLANYVEPEYIPAPVGKAVTSLPAVSVNVSGAIDVRDNFKVFAAALTDFVETRLIREPKTDQDFADLDLQIKALAEAEKALKGAEANMLSQVESVDLAKRTLDALHKLARDNRLAAEKLLAAKKESIKAEIINEGREAYDAHIRSLNDRLGNAYLSTAKGTVRDADFTGAIKGRRTVTSLREAVAVTLANAKIAASATADKIDANLKTLRELAAAHAFLFADTAQIVMKDNADLVLLIHARIAEHKAAEDKRLEAERERIRQEEAKKLADAAEAQRKADEKAAADAKAAAEAATAAAAPPVSPPNPADVADAATPTMTATVAAVVPQAAVQTSGYIASAPQLSDRAAAFLASRDWPNQAARNTARAVLVEFERFCAQQEKAAA